MLHVSEEKQREINKPYADEKDKYPQELLRNIVWEIIIDSQFHNSRYPPVGGRTIDEYIELVKVDLLALIDKKRVEAYGKDLLNKYPDFLDFTNKEQNIVTITEDAMDIVFNMLIAYYTDLYNKKKAQEDKRAEWEQGLKFLGLSSFVKFTQGYPEEINKLFNAMKMLITWGKFNEKNQIFLLGGIYNFIEAQKEEINDFFTADGYEEFTSFKIQLIIQMIQSYRPYFKKLSRRGGRAEGIAINDIYPQAAGKDDTNELDFCKEPMRDTAVEKERRTSEGKEAGATLDYMRNRHASEKAGGVKYDYEYSKVGFDIKLEKGINIDLTKIYAHNAAVAQTLKSFILELIKEQWYEKYEAGDFFSFIEKLTVNNHKVTDLKEEEINPSIQKFNTEAGYKSLTNNLNRYPQGYYPIISHDIKLDLINESNEKYYKDYNEIYSQLSGENLAKFNKIQHNKEADVFYKEKSKIIYFYIPNISHDTKLTKEAALNAYKDNIYKAEPKSIMFNIVYENQDTNKDTKKYNNNTHHLITKYQNSNMQSNNTTFTFFLNSFDTNTLKSIKKDSNIRYFYIISCNATEVLNIEKEGGETKLYDFLTKTFITIANHTHYFKTLLVWNEIVSKTEVQKETKEVQNALNKELEANGIKETKENINKLTQQGYI